MDSLNKKILCDKFYSDDVMEDFSPKNVLFRDVDDNSGNGMMVDNAPAPLISWKEKLLGHPSKSEETENDEDETDYIQIMDEDVLITLLNGSPANDFSDRIRQILFRDMENTMVLKLLGRNIGFSVLQNKIYSLWKPMAPIHLRILKTVTSWLNSTTN